MPAATARTTAATPSGCARPSTPRSASTPPPRPSPPSSCTNSSSAVCSVSTIPSPTTSPATRRTASTRSPSATCWITGPGCRTCRATHWISTTSATANTWPTSWSTRHRSPKPAAIWLTTRSRVDSSSARSCTPPPARTSARYSPRSSWTRWGSAGPTTASRRTTSTRSRSTMSPARRRLRRCPICSPGRWVSASTAWSSSPTIRVFSPGSCRRPTW